MLKKYIATALAAGLIEAQIAIWFAAMPGGWPTTLAVESEVALSEKAVYEWDFGDQTNVCTTNGKPNVSPCAGRVIDHVYAQNGNYTVSVTVRDNGKTYKSDDEIEVKSLDSLPIAYRAELRNLPEKHWSLIVKALYRLKELGVYDHFARIHRNSFSEGVSGGSSQRSAAHGGPAFLPWHRASMRIIERCMQVATADDTLGMPYWDWTMKYDGLEKYLGGNGNSKNHDYVEDGPFCNVAAGCLNKWILPADMFPVNGDNIRRQFGLSDPNYKFPSKDDIARLLSIENYDLPPFNNFSTPGSFRNALEGWLFARDQSYGSNHNGVHRWMGGTMGSVQVSFFDPAFLFHHVQVDRLFTQWQQKTKCDDGHGSAQCYRPGDTDPGVTQSADGTRLITDSTGKQRYVIAGQMYGDTMWPWSLRIVDALVANQGYEYVDGPPPEPKNVTGLPPSKLATRPRRSGADSSAIIGLWTLAVTLFSFYFNFF
jgi:PKD repeat protein